MKKLRQKIKNHPYFDAWQRWEYKHTTLLLIGLTVFIFLLDTSLMVYLRSLISGMGYFGALVAGLFSVSVFTAIPAMILLAGFSDLNIVLVAMIAGIGSMLGDYIILKYAEEKVAYELKPIAYHFGIPQTISFLQGRKSTLGVVRLIGALVIASPLPDEIGIGLLGMGRLKRTTFLFVCYVLNVVGIMMFLLPIRAISNSI